MEPFHGILLDELMLESYFTDSLPSVGNIEARSAEDNIKVETIDTNARIVLDTQVNVFLDTETEVAGVGEVLLSQFVFTDLIIQQNRLFNFKFRFKLDTDFLFFDCVKTVEGDV